MKPDSAAGSPRPRLELVEVSKRFPGVQALDRVSLSFRAGEIHGLMGENGAGKSTAIRIIAGLQKPDSGRVLVEGEPVDFDGPRDAAARGIGLVPQEISVIPDASVAENILIDRLVRRWPGVVDWPAVEREARRAMDRVGLGVDPGAVVRHMSAAQKQLVQIAKALAGDARVLILDEPTSALTEHEAGRLFARLRELRAQGVAIVFVSHKLEEVRDLCDRVSVLRDGRWVGTCETAALAEGELVRMMIGRDSMEGRIGRLDPEMDVEVLRAENLSSAGRVDGVSLSLHRGEILGLYGLIGSGRTEFARALVGGDPIESGRVFIRGREVAIRSVGDSLYRHRMGYVSENRKEDGIFLEESVRTNLAIAGWPGLVRGGARGGLGLLGWISAAREAALASHHIGALSIRTPSDTARAGDLSGGNQQKISIGKWLAADCDILIVDEPTIGVDVGAKRQIHQLIRNLAAVGRKSVILISSELAEVVNLSSRMLVFRDRRIACEIRDIEAAGKSYADVSREIAPWLA